MLSPCRSKWCAHRRRSLRIRFSAHRTVYSVLSSGYRRCFWCLRCRGGLGCVSEVIAIIGRRDVLPAPSLETDVLSRPEALALSETIVAQAFRLDIGKEISAAELAKALSTRAEAHPPSVGEVEEPKI